MTIRGATSTEKLVQLDARCPHCGKKEPRRIAQWRVTLYSQQDRDRLCETVTCDGCKKQYFITAAAYQGAA